MKSSLETAAARLARAESLVAQITHLENEWRRSVSRQMLLDDSQCLATVRLVADPAPIDEVSLLTSEALHHVRSTLDNIAWGCVPWAPRQAMTDTARRAIAFPVVFDESEWQPRVSACLPATSGDVKETVKQFQPFVMGGVAGSASVAMLALLNNEDKHRRLVSARYASAGWRDGASGETDRRLNAFRSTITYNIINASPSPGDVMYTVKFGLPVRRGTVKLSGSDQPLLVVETGTSSLQLTYELPKFIELAGRIMDELSDDVQ